VSESRRNDMRLARRVLGGDEAAFEEFFDGYFPRLYRFALARLDGREDAAEDVVQATLCNAMTGLKTFRGEAALFTWLCTLCRHEIGAYIRRHGRPSAAVELVEDAPEIRAALESLAASAGGDPEEPLHRREIARLVQVALDALPSRYGDALEWKYVHGLSVREIAARLRLGPKAAESLLTRARQAFREGFAALTGGRWGLDSGGR
jgi:RNA polymerase sigma-70 factor (ECF subfamily)